MDRIETQVKAAVQSYALPSDRLNLMFLANEDEHTYAVTMSDKAPRRYPAEMVILARVEGDTVIIEADKTDRPLYDRLVAQGISADKIICAYADDMVSVGA